MGVILDSSVLVEGERRGLSPRALLEKILAEINDEEVGISSISVMELAHGAARANTQDRRHSREHYLRELLSVIPVYAVTSKVALRAGILDGRSQANGVRIPISDLLIGVTALELQYRVATGNLRHFSLIEGLEVIALSVK